VTWLPYEKISNLQALTAYLDLLGFDRIADLPLGNGGLVCAPRFLSRISQNCSNSDWKFWNTVPPKY